MHHQLTQTTSNVNDINFSATDIGANKTTDFRLHLTYLPDDKQSKEPTDFSWSGHLKIDTDQQQVDCTDCHLEMNETLANGQKIPFDATSDIHYQLNDQSLSAPSIKGTLDDVQFTAQLAAKSLKENPDVNFSFTANTEHLSAILKKWGFAIKTQNPQTLQNFSLSGTGQLHNKQLDIPTIKLKVDSSTLSGSVQSADISHRAFNAQFSLDNLDIGAYLPPAKPNKLLQLKELTGSFKILLPLEQQSLAISGPLKFTTLTTDTFAISQFSTLLDMKDGFIALSKSQADLLGGHYQGSSQIDLSGSNPKFVSNQTFTNIQIEPLVRLLDPKLQLSGLANISGSINSIGATLPLIKQNLNGNLKLSIKHGVLHGINIQQWINTAGALVQQKPLADTPSDNSTDFGDLSASMSINSGVINNQDLVMNMPFAHATGRGTIDLAGEQLDYHLLISQIRHLSRIDSVPLSISGSFANPHIQLDKNALFQQVANKQFTGQKGRLADRLTQRRGNKEIDQTINKLIQRVDINKLLGH